MINLIFILYKFLDIKNLTLRRLRNIVKSYLHLMLGLISYRKIILCHLLPVAHPIVITEELQDISYLDRENTVDYLMSLFKRYGRIRKLRRRFGENIKIFVVSSMTLF